MGQTKRRLNDQNLRSKRIVSTWGLHGISGGQADPLAVSSWGKLFLKSCLCLSDDHGLFLDLIAAGAYFFETFEHAG